MLRSYEKEFLDQETLKTADLYRNLLELDIINKRLGGYQASRKGLAALLKKKAVKNILDLGFGGGDSIKELSKFSVQQGQELFFYGVDLKKDCVNYAETNLASLHNKQLICDDYLNIPAALMQQIDVVHCSLFLHHLREPEIIELFRFCRTSNCSVLANDLHRHPLAYYSIKVLTALFSRSYLVKNDAPLSVKRGFKKRELEALLREAGFADYSVRWSWAFRYIVVATP